MDIIGVHTPLGLGLQRTVCSDLRGRLEVVSAVSVGTRLSKVLSKAEDPGEDLVPAVTDLHLLSAEEVEPVLDTLADRSIRQAVIASAAPLPAGVLAVASELLTARSCEAGFAQSWVEVSGGPPELAESASVFSGGWPEAVVADADGLLVPSVSLHHFVQSLRERRASLLELPTLIAARDGGLPAGLLARTTGDGGDAGTQVRELEQLGVVTWDGHTVHLAVPALERLLLPTDTERRAGLMRVAAVFADSDPETVAIARARAGSDIGPDDRTLLLRALEAAENDLAVSRWHELCDLCIASPWPELRRRGRSSRMRLEIAAGRLETAAAVVGSCETGEAKSDDMQKMAGVQLVSHSRAMGLGHLDEGDIRAGFPEMPAFAIDAGALRAMPALMNAARGERVQLSAPGTDVDIGELERFIRAMTCLVQRNFQDAERERDLLEDAPVLRHVVSIALFTLTGHYVEAAQIVNQLNDGSDPISAPPLHRTIMLNVLAGSDVARTRELLPHVKPLPFGQLGAFPANVARAKACLMTGRVADARRHFSEVWDAADSRGLHGFNSLIALDVLDAHAFGDGLARFVEPDPRPVLRSYVTLGRALHEHSGCGALAAAELFPRGSYDHGRAVALAGRVFLAAGDTATAGPLLERAHTIFEVHGAPVDAARTRAELRRFDFRAMWRDDVMDAEEGDDRDDVTARERQVLTLVADGLSNKEIAAQLHISMTTTKRHISSLFRRYDVTSRRHLAEVARSASRAF